MNKNVILHLILFILCLFWAFIIFNFNRERFKPKNIILKKLIKIFRVLQFKYAKSYVYFDSFLHRCPEWTVQWLVIIYFFIFFACISGIVFYFFDDCSSEECGLVITFIMAILITKVVNFRYIKYFKQKLKNRNI